MCEGGLGEVSGSFVVMGVRRGCNKSPRLFNILVEVKMKVLNIGAKLRLKGEVWPIVTRFFADDTVLLAGSEGALQRVLKEFHSVCKG